MLFLILIFGSAAFGASESGSNFLEHAGSPLGHADLDAFYTCALLYSLGFSSSVLYIFYYF
jgi:hypothetical protein